MGKQETLDTIWEVPDELCVSRSFSDARQMLNGIIFRFANGTYRESLGTTAHPSHLSRPGCLGPNVGSPSGRVRKLGGVDWQAAGAGKARFGGT